MKYLLAQHGLPPVSTSTVSAGSNMARVALLERGSVSAAVLSDPALTLFLRRYPNASVLADVRSKTGVQQVYGTDNYVSATLISRSQWLHANPETARRLARAMNQSLHWIQTHSPEEIGAQTPTELQGTDPGSFLGSTTCFPAQLSSGRPF